MTLTLVYPRFARCSAVLSPNTPAPTMTIGADLLERDDMVHKRKGNTKVTMLFQYTQQGSHLFCHSALNYTVRCSCSEMSVVGPGVG